MIHYARYAMDAIPLYVAIANIAAMVFTVDLVTLMYLERRSRYGERLNPVGIPPLIQPVLLLFTVGK
jgi:hypothetical protein